VLAYFWQHVFDVDFPSPSIAGFFFCIGVTPNIIEFLISFSLTEVKKFLSFSHLFPLGEVVW